jgi:hypothetical protein
MKDRKTQPGCSKAFYFNFHFFAGTGQGFLRRFSENRRTR